MPNIQENTQNNNNQSLGRSLLTVRQFSIKYPAFPEGGLRYLIFNQNHNGFGKCIRRVGKKVLIDETAFFAWVDSNNHVGGTL
jgi:hypothetical protein